MGDYIYAKITLGGPLPSRLLEPLIQQLELADVAIDWAEGHKPDEIGKAVYAAATAGMTVAFTGRPRAGTFDDLEHWLQSNGIHYDRQSDGFAEYDAEMHCHRGGGANAVANMMTTQEGHPVVVCEPLLATLDNPHLDIADKLIKLRNQLRPPGTETLSPLFLAT
jgi:hypothetical protein